MFYRLGLIACVLVTIAACSSSKKVRKDKDAEYVMLDTVEKVSSRENPYRATAPRD